MFYFQKQQFLKRFVSILRRCERVIMPAKLKAVEQVHFSADEGNGKTALK